MRTKKIMAGRTALVALSTCLLIGSYNYTIADMNDEKREHHGNENGHGHGHEHGHEHEQGHEHGNEHEHGHEHGNGNEHGQDKKRREIRHTIHEWCKSNESLVKAANGDCKQAWKTYLNNWCSSQTPAITKDCRKAYITNWCNTQSPAITTGCLKAFENYEQSQSSTSGTN